MKHLQSRRLLVSVVASILLVMLVMTGIGLATIPGPKRGYLRLLHEVHRPTSGH